ncbi:MAG: bifunctional phosphoribosylaminoimidazolecarboxamide formyltransferase/IMP cyclohydrolase [Chloroflexi bacterium]|nr:bifunctional phosphoribosylaminoimidazolecarboxamide formyltransferase/IMP cyclohydrolase [Chloroflexota bacterium]
MRALISVWDKSGLVEFARTLARLGVDLISSGGTATVLREAGLDVTEVAELTQFPEMLDGRVKTLHPAVHAGILARRDKQDHLDALAAHGLAPIDLVVSNLYPFASDPSIEMIDIGGVALIRAAAKNHQDVAILTSPSDYHQVARELELQGEVSEPTRRRLAAQAFALTAAYDGRIAAWFNLATARAFPEHLTIGLAKSLDLRYGENPHQQAAFYSDAVLSGGDHPALSNMRQLHGKELSFNNLLDIDAAVNSAAAFSEPCVAIIKHTNPCGLAVRRALADAYTAAYEGDQVSAYGSVIACNRHVDLATADAMSGLFIEVIVAPGFDEAAFMRLTAKRANVRLIEMPGNWPAQPDSFGELDVKRVRGGFLVQTRDADNPAVKMDIVSKRAPTAAEVADLGFAWKVVRQVKSNAIVLARDQMLLGVGAGQMSRVESVDIAVRKAGERARGSVLASDAFFPFADNVEHAAAAGVTAVIQPGGSTHDPEVIAAVDAAGMAMAFTGERHFKH